MTTEADGFLDHELAEAAFVCDLLRVRDLLQRGASPNARDREGRPPLVSAILGNSVALVGLLLESKADVNATDPHGWTPLHFAAPAGHTAVVELLLTRGADVNAVQNNRRTALIDVFGNEPMKALLRRHGAHE